MKKLFYMISAVALMASFASCNKIEQGNTSAETPSVDGTTTITVSASVPQTKVLFMGKDQNKLRWTSGDLVTLFGENGSSLTSTAPETGATSNFTFAGWPAEDTPRYLVYNGALLDEIEEGQLQSGSSVRPPVFEDGKVTMTVRTSQSITNDYSFGKHANLSIGALVLGADGGYTTEMKNVCGVIKFSFANKDKIQVKNVLIRNVDASASPMAGMVKVDYNDGVPTAEVIEGTGKTEVLVKAKGDCFENKYYCACILPGIYEPEIVLNYDIDGVEPIRLKAQDGAKIEIKRNEIFDFGTIDNIKLPEQPGTEKIVFNMDFTNRNLFTTTMVSQGNSGAKDNPVSYTYQMGDTGYVFKIRSTGYGWSSGTTVDGVQYAHFRLCNNVEGKKGYLQLPGIPEYKLTSVNVETNNTASKTYTIYSGDPYSDDAVVNVSLNVEVPGGSTADKRYSKTATLVNPVVGESYYLYVDSSNTQITTLVLTYTK